MKTLMIEDLSVAKELDGREMSAVRGGGTFGVPVLGSYPYFPSFPSSTINFSAAQSIGQESNTLNNVANDSALDQNVQGNPTTKQNAHNTINFL